MIKCFWIGDSQLNFQNKKNGSRVKPQQRIKELLRLENTEILNILLKS